MNNTLQESSDSDNQMLLLHLEGLIKIYRVPGSGLVKNLPEKSLCPLTRKKFSTPPLLLPTFRDMGRQSTMFTKKGGVEMSSIFVTLAKSRSLLSSLHAKKAE